MTVSAQWLHGWLAGRSRARGLPAPIADHGGYRVDTNSAEEVCRWVFAEATPGLISLGQSVQAPRQLLKLCGPIDALQALLPAYWQVGALSYFMQGDGVRRPADVPRDYTIHVTQNDGVAAIQIIAPDGSVAASGYAAETDDAFIYDRIVTAPDHQRRGLGRAMMAALGQQKQNPATPELLVATAPGRALYTTIGWQVVSPYVTGQIPA